MADLNRDTIIEKKDASLIDLATARGVEQAYSEIIGIPAFMKLYKVQERKEVRR